MTATRPRFGARPYGVGAYGGAPTAPAADAAPPGDQPPAAGNPHDPDLAVVLRRLLLTTGCPKYMRDVAPAWLAWEDRT